MMSRWIGLLDCNNFFVSCERLFRPDLWQKPVVVLSSNDGCIVARSQEVKDMGVPMGVPYFQVKDSLAHAGTTVFSSHFALYRDLSRRVFSVLREEVSVVEEYSIDEAFFLIDSADPMVVATRLRQTVEQRVGIPVSIGVATSKTLAKCANAHAKKTTGCDVLPVEQWRTQASRTPLASIWGVGGRLAQRYQTHGLASAGDLMAADRTRVARCFGVVGVRLQRELWGESVFPVAPQITPPKSLRSSRSFSTTTTDRAVLADAIAYHVRQVAATLRTYQFGAQYIRVSVRPNRHGDFFLRGGQAEAVLPQPSNDTLELLRTAQQLVDVVFEPGVPYQKAGVEVGRLAPDGTVQSSLFTATGEADVARATLWQAVDGVNRRFGREVVQVGSRRRQAQWRPKQAQCSPAYTTRWLDVARVKSG